MGETMLMLPAGVRMINPVAVTLSGRHVLSRAFDLLLIPIVCFIITIKVWDAGSPNKLMVAAALIYLAKLIIRPGRWKLGTVTLIDIAVVVTLLLEVVEFYASTYKANSLLHMVEALFVFLFYALMRLNPRADYQRLVIYIFITLLGFGLSVGAIFLFALQYTRAASLGFSDITALKPFFYLFGLRLHLSANG